MDGITTEIQSFQQQSDAFEREIRDCEDRLTQVDTILNNRKSLSEAEKKKVELEAVIDGDDYKRQKALIVNWDATTRQRQLFVAMKKAQKEKEQAEHLLRQQQDSFVKLSADLEERYRLRCTSMPATATMESRWSCIVVTYEVTIPLAPSWSM